MEQKKKISTDKRTTEWVEQMQKLYPGQSVIYTARQCPSCGLYYNSKFEHECEKVEG